MKSVSNLVNSFACLHPNIRTKREGVAEKIKPDFNPNWLGDFFV